MPSFTNTLIIDSIVSTRSESRTLELNHGFCSQTVEKDQVVIFVSLKSEVNVRRAFFFFHRYLEIKV